MKRLINHILSYKIEILMAICLMSNLYVDIPQILYYVLWFYLIYLYNKTNSKPSSSRSPLTYGLIAIIFFSTIMSGQFSYRFIMMSLLLYIALSKESLFYFRSKVRLLWCSLFFFIATGPINYYAHTKNINYQLYTWTHRNETFTLDFSGFTCHPMWLSAACGIGIIFCTYWLLRFYREKRYIFMAVSLVLLYTCVMVTIWGGSRSATFLSLAAGASLVFFTSKSVTNYIAIFSVVTVLAIVAMPSFIAASERMQEKKGGLDFQTSDGSTSRTELWNARFEEFESSPIWGVGFGVTGIDEKASEGRAETGSGWLTVLSQTGIIGFLLVCLLVKRAILPLKLIRSNDKIALFTALLLFFCMHTMFEAYMFQAGWYLCLVFWLLVSVLDDYRNYYKTINLDEVI